MAKLTDKEKIKRIQVLYRDFHIKISILLKRQTKLLEKSMKLVDENKLEEIRNKIKKI